MQGGSAAGVDWIDEASLIGHNRGLQRSYLDGRLLNSGELIRLTSWWSGIRGANAVCVLAAGLRMNRALGAQQ